MISKLRFPLSLILLFSTIFCSAQTDSISFGAPLNIPMYLSGNFGEIRSGHFHAGIDIKTQQVEGLPVLAAADGYISRIKITLGGYGNALYITHPNGYTTTYGHLQQFNDEINELVLTKQYSKEKFTVELFLPATRIPVKKGDTIALSGNSGGSGGPHLHFEIRKTKGLVPQNPLLFGFDIKDNIAPILKNLAMYPLNDTSFVNGSQQPVIFSLKKSGNGYVLNSPESLKAKGVIGFGIEVIDKLNGANNRCGVYNVTLKADSHTVYAHQMDAIRFENTRFINSHVDFYEWKKNTRRIQKSFLTSYNNLDIYQNVSNQGKVYFSKYGHHLQYHITDVAGNESTLDFNVSVDTNTYTLPNLVDSARILDYTRTNFIETENIRIKFPAFSLYENLRFHHKMGDTIKHAVSPVHHVQDLYTGLHKYIQLDIKTPLVNDSVGNKYIAASLNKSLKLLSPEGGKYSKGWVSFKTRSLGPYTIMIDTIAPTIRPVNFSTKNPDVKHLTSLILKTEDDVSGVKTYNAHIDGQWHLLHYDYKTGHVWLNFSDRSLEAGKHHLEIKIRDTVNNLKSYSFDFIW